MATHDFLEMGAEESIVEIDGRNGSFCGHFNEE